MNKDLIDNLAASKGLLKKELAQHLGITHNHMCYYSTGRSLPSLNVLIRIYALSDGQITPNDFYLPAIQKALEESPEKYIINNPKIIEKKEMKNE